MATLNRGDTMNNYKSEYEFKIEKVLNVYSDLNILWRVGKVSVATFNDLCEILDEYTDFIEEVTQ